MRHMPEAEEYLSPGMSDNDSTFSHIPRCPSPVHFRFSSNRLRRGPVMKQGIAVTLGIPEIIDPYNAELYCPD